MTNHESRSRVGGLIEDLPEAADPLAVVRFHQHGAEARDTATILRHPGPREIEELDRQLRESQVEIPVSRLLEDAPREVGGRTRAGGPRRPDEDVQFGGKSSQETAVGRESPVERERRIPAGLESTRELTASRERQQPLRGPERDRGGPWPGALEADLPQVQVRRGKIGVRRLVLVEAA